MLWFSHPATPPSTTLAAASTWKPRSTLSVGRHARPVGANRRRREVARELGRLVLAAASRRCHSVDSATRLDRSSGRRHRQRSRRRSHSHDADEARSSSDHEQHASIDNSRSNSITVAESVRHNINPLKGRGVNWLHLSNLHI